MRIEPQDTGRDEVPLAAAALELGLSWHVAYARVLTGALDGRQEASGRWYVTKESVTRLKELQRQIEELRVPRRAIA